MNSNAYKLQIQVAYSSW